MTMPERIKEALGGLFVALSNVGAALGVIASWQEHLEWGLRIFGTVAAITLTVVSIIYQARRDRRENRPPGP
jgi:hypothetical protein